MPEDERTGLYDPEEEFAWDAGLSDPGESELQDLLSEDEEE